MTEKVKVTQEQADAIEYLRSGKDGGPLADEEIIESHVSENEHWSEEAESLNDLSLIELVDALRIGYEVEPEYKVGDAVRYWKNDSVQAVGTINYINYENGWSKISGNTVSIKIEDIKCRATPEEIKAEQERRWWNDNGRKVWELKQGDVLMAPGRTIYEVTADPKSHKYDCYTGNDQCDFDIEECKRENWEVICFHENRKDVRHA